MAKVISQMLVGIGVQYDDSGAKEASSGLDSIRASALKLGGIAAGVFGANALTFGAAGELDALGKFSESYGLIANDVQGLGYALELAGGQAGDMMNNLETLARFQAGQLVGDTGFLEAASVSGIDTSPILEAANATEAFLELARQVEGMDVSQAINVGASLGFDADTMRLLAGGADDLRAKMAEAAKIRPIDQELVREAYEFNDQLTRSQLLISGIGDKVTRELLPAINNVTESLSENSDAIIDGFGTAVEVMVAGGKTIHSALEGVGKFMGETAGAIHVGMDGVVKSYNDIQESTGSNTFSQFSGFSGSYGFNPTAAMQMRPKITINPGKIEFTNTIDGQVFDKRTEKIINNSLDVIIEETASNTQ